MHPSTACCQTVWRAHKTETMIRAREWLWPIFARDSTQGGELFPLRHLETNAWCASSTVFLLCSWGGASGWGTVRNVVWGMVVSHAELQLRAADVA